MDLDMIDLRAVLLDPVDVKGLPHVKDGIVHWCPPSFLPYASQKDRRPGVVFVDELAQAPPLVQAAFLQLILDHKVGDLDLHPDWRWIAASNRQEDRAGAHRLISPLLNRFVHLDVEVSNDDWSAWALSAGIATEVRSFIKFRPALLFDFDPTRNERAFPTPRSWEFVSRLLRHVEDDLLLAVVSGTVGSGPAAEFCGFLQIWKGLPDVDKVLANPTAGTVPKEPAVLFALSGAIGDKCKAHKDDVALLGRACDYAKRMPAEFSVLTFRDLTQVCPQIFKIPSARDWLSKHSDVLGVR
jgi:hypothetical protein